MGGRRPLRGGLPRALGRHDGWAGKAYRRAYLAFETDLGPFTEMQKLEAARVAALRVQLDVAMAVLIDAQHRRREGRGRRPNHALLERLARRAGLADGSYGAAFARLQDLCRGGASSSVAAALRRVKA